MLLHGSHQNEPDFFSILLLLYDGAGHYQYSSIIYPDELSSMRLTPFGNGLCVHNAGAAAGGVCIHRILSKPCQKEVEEAAIIDAVPGQNVLAH